MPTSRAGIRRSEGYFANRRNRNEGVSLSLAREHARDDPILNLDLEPLSQKGRQLAPDLNLMEVSFGEAIFQYRCGQQVRGGDRVLDGEIDADAADRGHGMRGITDAQQARTMP